MIDRDLQQRIREALDRRLAERTGAGSHGTHSSLESPRSAGIHVSHAQYVTLVNLGDACLVEPAVPCNHCGYCKSHGH